MSGGYFSNQELFMQPEVTQHNSHMVMTGVKKPHKTKRLNVDTRFCDDYNVNTNSLLPTPQPVAIDKRFLSSVPKGLLFRRWPLTEFRKLIINIRHCIIVVSYQY